jgi:hypothetical protein
MRRSKASAPASGRVAALSRGQNSAAAIKSDGSMKKIWLAVNIAGCTI